MQERHPVEIPEPILGRLHRYRLALRRLRREGRTTVASQALGELSGVTAVLVRKDLSRLGPLGQRGVGYALEPLLRQIEYRLQRGEPQALMLIGAGNLGAAVAGYLGFDMQEYRLAGVFDSNPARVGHRLQGIVVRPMRELPQAVRGTGVRLGILALPAAQAQGAADFCAAAGLRALLNFAPVQVQAPSGVVVRQLDLTEELQILQYQLKGSGPGGPEQI